VLTIKNVTPGQGVNYFKQENYYSKEAARKHSNWAGKGAAKFKLQGAVDGKAFKNLLNGYSPDGEQALTGKKGKKNRRAAIDCTFSAPKSISLAALMGGQTELIEAHQRAVARTLKIIEEQYSQARVWDGHKQQRVNTGNLITAQFHHTTSRERDPQLHTHCVIINATQLPDGRWRALSNEAIYWNKKLLGAIYRNELAQECRKLGYEIEKRPDELFEIKGYTQQQLEHFSKRRGHILSLVGPDATAEEKQWAALYQRPSKGKEAPLEDLVGWWQAQDEALNLGIQHPIPQPEQSSEVTSHQADEINRDAIEAVCLAIEHCSERTVAFRRQAIEAFVLSEIQTFNYADLETAIAANSELIQTYDERFTTQKALDRELATIRLMLQGQGQAGAIAHPEVVEGCIQAELERLAQEGKRLTQGQQEAVRLAATTQDQFSAWCGVAGSGKTYSLQLLKAISQDQGYTVRGFAPSGNATRVLGEELGMETQTVAMLLLSKKPQQTEQAQARQLWIVDEAGLLSAKDGYRLLKRAREEGARIVLVGDYRQNSAVEAGSPFRSLLSAGIAVAQMNESLRQKTPELKHAADLAATGHHGQALSHLKGTGRIEQLEAIEQRTEAIAQEYLKLTPQERSQTLILAGTHKEKAALVSRIREGLKAEGTLSPEEVPLVRLNSKDLTTVQSRFTHHINQGEIVVPVREYKRLGLHKFTPYCVEAIRDDKLLLSDPAGNLRLADPMKFRKQVYTQEELAISVGDRLRWTQGDRELGHINGEEFTVTSLEGYTATIQYDNGKTESLYLDQPLHLDYALVSTTYSSQGKTADHALISSTVDATVSQESIYVAISRTRHDLKIFAEDLEFLMEHAQESSVQRNPLELLVQTKPEAQMQAPVNKTDVEAPSQPDQQPVTLRQPSASPMPKPKRREPQTKPPTPKPQKLQPFWIPEPAPPAPSHIEEKHWQELVVGSAIHPALAQLNAESVAGQEVYERLLATKLEQIGGSGQYVTRSAANLMKAYECVAEGGWWARAGINARSLPHLQPGEQPERKLWGSFKPDHPRVDASKSQSKGETEFVKYEHPLAEERQLFLFEVPDELAQRIYDKHGIQPTEADKQSGFWYIVWKYNLPVTLTEGAKKTLASLSQGEVTIGLSGVNGGYFAKDKEGHSLPQRQLHPELAVFATPGREFRFAFDHDTKPSTIANVRRDLVRTGDLLELAGCTVETVKWQGDKGLDDLIANQGPLAYAKAHAHPAPLAWEAQKHYRSEYTRLSRQVRKAQPGLQGERLDVEVYKLAAARGDIRDGARAIAQSDRARSLQKTLPSEQAQQQVQAYIQRIDQLLSHPTEKPTHERETQQSRQSVQPGPRQATPADPGPARPAEPEIQLPGEPDQGVEPAGQSDPTHLEAGIERLARAIDERAERRSLLRCCGSFDEAVERFDTALGQAQQIAARLERVHQQLESQARRAEPNEQRQSPSVAEDLAAAIGKAVEMAAVQSNPTLLQGLQQLSERLSELPSPEAEQSTLPAIPPQVFLGSLPTPEQLRPARNYGPAYKPNGGLWTSAYHPQQGSEWLRFVRSEGLRSEAELQQMQVWRVQPKPDVKVLVVDSPEVLQSLPHLPPRFPEDDVHPLDYEAISQEYDAMLVKREAIADAAEVYSFDIESTIWFGTRGWPFESVEPLPMPQAAFPSSLPLQETTHEQTQQPAPRPEQRDPGEQYSTRDASSPGARDEQSARAADHGELSPADRRGSDATPGADRAPGAAIGAIPAGADSSLAATARELSEGLNAAAELQEVQRLAEAISQLDRNLEQRLRSHRQTGGIRRAVEQLHREVAAYPGQSEAGDLLRNLADALAQQTVANAPELATAIEALSQRLEQLEPQGHREEVTHSIQALIAQLRQSDLQAVADGIEAQATQRTPELNQAVAQLTAKLNSLSAASVDRKHLYESVSELTQHLQEQDRRQLLEGLAGAIAEQEEQAALQTNPGLNRVLSEFYARLEQLSQSGTQDAAEGLTANLSSYTQQLAAELRQAQLDVLVDAIEGLAVQESDQLPEVLHRLIYALERMSSSEGRESIERLTTTISTTTEELSMNIPGLDHSLIDGEWQRGLPDKWEINKDGLKTKVIDRSRPSRPTSTPQPQQAETNPSAQTPETQPPEPETAPATSPEADQTPFQLADYTDRQQWPAAKQRLTKDCLLPEVFIEALHEKGIIEADPQGQPVFTRYAMYERMERGELTGAHLDRSSVGQGHFWVQFGQGGPQRVLITSSPLDALSLAALERREVPTLYLAVDASGGIPTAQVQRLLEQQAQVTVAVNRAEEPLARQLLERLPGATRRAPEQGYSWNEQLQQRRYQAIYEHYSDNGKTSDILGIMRRALQDGRSTKEISMILAQHPSLEVVGSQRIEAEVQKALKEQQAPPIQPVQLSPQQLWQQYSQQAKAANPVSVSLEVAQMALQDQVPDSQIRQILQANPHLQEFGEKGRGELVEQPLAKAKRLEALARNPQKEQSRQEQHKGLDLQN